MAVTYNIKGTTNPSFKIGKKGVVLSPADNTSETTLTIPNASGTAALLESTQTFTGAITFDASGNSVIVSDTLRIAQSGSGLRMTNVGAFDNDGSDNFRIYGTNNLYLRANGENGGGLSIDSANQDVTIDNNLIVSGNLTVQGTTTTVDSTTVNVQNAFVFEGATDDGFETTLTVTDPTADRTITLPDATGTVALTSDLTSYITASSTDTLTNKTMTAPVLNAPVFGIGTNSPYFTEIRFNNSNIMKFNQMYTGAASGSYFSANEYQKVVTITPDGNSQNYQVIGRITAQNAGETHTVYFNAALRSNTLPDLNWTIDYSEEYNGGRYIDPQLWTKETTTAGFIFAFKTLATIYGTVTVDFDVIPRNSSQLDNVSVNSVQNSEQVSVDAGYTANDMTRVMRRQGTVHTFSGNILPDTTETYDIGSSTLRFNDIYLAGSTVDIGGTKLSKDSNGDLDIKDSSDVRKTIKAAAIELFDTDGKAIKIERDATSGKMKTRKFGSDGSEETSQDVIDISEDKSPKLGGDLDTNGNDINFADNKKAQFGTSNDLKIYHDGSHSYIQEEGAGALQIRGANLIFDNADGSKRYAYFQESNKAELYFNNTARFSTTNTGATVTGTLVSDGLTIDTDTLYVDSTNNRVGIGTTAPSTKLSVEGTSADVASFIRGNNSGSGQIHLGNSDGYVRVGGANGSFTVYNSTNTSARLYIDNTGKVGIGNNTSPSVELDVTGDGAFSGNVTVTGNLTVNGTTTTVNSTEINVQNAFVFEGATDDGFETTLTVTDPTADRTITLPDSTGTVALTSDLTSYLSGNIGFPTDLGLITGATTDHLGLGPDLGSIASGDTFVGLVKDFGIIDSYISLTELKAVVSASTDFADFKTRIADL